MNKIYVIERKVRGGRWLLWLIDTNVRNMMNEAAGLYATFKGHEYRFRVYTDPHGGAATAKKDRLP